MARIRTSDEAPDYFDGLDDLADGGVFDRIGGARSEEEALSELFDDPTYGGSMDDEDEDE